MRSPKEEEIMKFAGMLVGMVALVAATGALAQSGANLGKPAGGSVMSRDGQVVTLLGANATEQKIALTPKTAIIVNAKSALSEVKANDFIGCTAIEGPDGKLIAQEIHIIPEAMRGLGEGHYPFGGPKTTMTNGNVEEFAAKTDGRKLRVSYKGGESTIDVGPETPVTKMVAGTPEMVAKGAVVNAFVKPAEGTAPSEANLVIIAKPAS
jgi:hypothetical protein